MPIGGAKVASMKGIGVRKVLKTHMGVLITLAAMWAFFSIASPWFSTVYNMLNILNHMTITLILSLGMVFVIASGGIDLSVGSILGFTGIVMAKLFKADVPIVVTVLLGFAVGGGIGALTGLIIAKFRLQPFIVTLGMLSIVRGLALVLSKGLPILGFPPQFTHFFAGTVGIPTNIYIMAVLVILVAIIANRTKFGIYARSIGGSEKSAILCGINTTRIKILIYMMQGLFAVVASLIFMSMMDAAEPLAGLQTEWLEAIAAPIIGGNSLSGGVLTVFGAVIGALILSTVRSGVNVLGVQSFAQQLFIGVIIIISVIVDSLRQRKTR
jgi:ribose transport system permease protein